MNSQRIKAGRVREAGRGLCRALRRKLLNDSSGMGTVEMILIIVVLIGLVIVFKQQINTLVQQIFATITSSTNQVIH